LGLFALVIAASARADVSLYNDDALGIDLGFTRAPVSPEPL